ncbi:hypothetical protein C5167_048243 [Papaver somniferum]|uniref:Uncharacterized protein n=1 Tax=Papaver somniferum TaxID=3469 RepID=A0A4Y7KHE5_PAPSO|nr:hypothetical protein C5167_048243 [Papaver somniferum]
MSLWWRLPEETQMLRTRRAVNPLKEELPKILVEEISDLNDETEPKVIDKDDGFRVEEVKVGSAEQTELVDRRGKEF